VEVEITVVPAAADEPKIVVSTSQEKRRLSALSVSDFPSESGSEQRAGKSGGPVCGQMRSSAPRVRVRISG